MNADSAYAIGATHAVCQDYAVAVNEAVSGCEAVSGSNAVSGSEAVARSGAVAGKEEVEGRGVVGSGVPSSQLTKEQATPYLILSDGCSSSPDTDIGARILVKAAEQALLISRPSATELTALHTEAARRALSWAEMTGLPPQAVDATLLTTHVCGDELIVGCSGDGVIAMKRWSGAIDIYAISYPAGYPLYPSYQHQPQRLLTLTQSGCSKEVKRYRSNGLDEIIRLEETATSDSLTEVFTFNTSAYKFAALLSDGIHSFFSHRQTETSKGVEAIPIDQIIKELISFKSINGTFVVRRLKKFLLQCAATGRQQRDDLAIAALYLGD